jgi:hypothetical protein
MNHYTDPDGRLWSRRELTALVKGWRIPKPLPRIQRYGAVDVVREDEREYGTKSRLLDALMRASDAREFVYGSSSATGLGGPALADACRRHHRRCRVFLAKRDPSRWTPQQHRILELGADVTWVANGMLSVTTARARQYAAKRKDRLFLPLGLEHPIVVAAMVKTARSVVRALKKEPTLVVSVGSSGTINRGLQLAFPGARVVFVETHHIPTDRQRGRAEVITSQVPKGAPAPLDEQPPFPSVAAMDGKGWIIATRLAPCLFWNIGTEAACVAAASSRILRV